LTPAGEVLQLQEAPDPPPSSLPLSFPQTSAEPLPPRTTSVATADFGTQTVPAPTFNVNTQTAPALPLVDKATQMGPPKFDRYHRGRAKNNKAMDGSSV
jgi:hypothetical protein